jgi:hypothetical protein
MVEESALRSTISFLGELGVYEVILPFLLVFTLVFAILEKTKLLGLEKVGGQEITKKNLNSMVALVTALLVVASTQLVAVINEVMSTVVLLLILILCFLLLVGSFFGDKEFTLKDYPGWIKFLMVFTFIGIVAIFLNALDWLQFLLAPLAYWDASWAVGIVFVVIILGFLWYIVKDPSTPKK